MNRCARCASGVPDVEIVVPRIDVTFSPVAGDETLLGARDPRVPVDVHRDMVAKAMAGIIPVTTLAQRERAMKSTSEIGVPPDLVPARNFGYIHPNLPAPRGGRWRFRNNRWFLGLLGG